MSNELSSSARKVQAALEVYGLSCHVVEMQETTRTAMDAAQAVGCQVGQIVKSLVFKGKKTQKPILVVASGANRVNTKKLGKIVSESLKMADPDFVREKTGFAIGGVPPLGHTHPLETFVDEDLMEYEEIWAAAGTPHALFKLTPDDLKNVTKGKVISVK
ncbi:YbaK/EbsC family protein [Thermodesulfobacteriota bacterium]